MRIMQNLEMHDAYALALSLHTLGEDVVCKKNGLSQEAIDCGDNYNKGTLKEYNKVSFIWDDESKEDYIKRLKAEM